MVLGTVRLRLRREIDEELNFGHEVDTTGEEEGGGKEKAEKVRMEIEDSEDELAL